MPHIHADGKPPTNTNIPIKTPITPIVNIDKIPRKILPKNKTSCQIPSLVLPPIKLPKPGMIIIS